MSSPGTALLLLLTCCWLAVRPTAGWALVLGGASVVPLSEVTNSGRSLAEVDTKAPTREECPECAFGKWDCHRSCTGQEDFGHLDTDFTYKAQDCIEEIPTGDNAVQVDLDIQCIYGFLPLQCDNMHNYRFDGVSFVEDCSPTTPFASDLLNESCSWVCKRGEFPTARCKWQFDPKNHIRAVGGVLDMCWVSKSCQDGQVMADAACRPTPFWSSEVSTPNAQLQQARERLASSKLANEQAKGLLEGALDQYSTNENASNANALSRARLKQNETEQALASVMTYLNGMLHAGAGSGLWNMTTDALRVQVEQQLAALVAELTLALTDLDASSEAHASLAEELDAAKVKHAEVIRAWNGTLDATKEEHSEDRQSLIEEIERQREQTEKQAKEKEEEETKSMVLIVIVVVILALSCALIIGGGFVINKLLLKPPPTGVSGFEGQVASDGGVVVVGRPLGADDNQPGPCGAPGKAGKAGKEKGEQTPLRAFAGKADSHDAPSPPTTAWK